MNRFYSITSKAALILLCCLMSCGSNGENSNRKEKETVFVCTGRYAKRYHYDNECPGLNSCKSKKIEISKKGAEEKGLTPCRLCK